MLYHNVIYYGVKETKTVNSVWPQTTSWAYAYYLGLSVIYCTESITPFKENFWHYLVVPERTK